MNRFKNKTLAALLAAPLGWLGLHRFYLHGTSSWPGYVYPAVTVLGMLGALVWLPLVVIAVVPLFTGMIEGLNFALTPDAKWDAKWNAGTGRENDSGWTVIIIAMLTLSAGVILGMSLLAIGLQTLFGATPG